MEVILMAGLVLGIGYGLIVLGSILLIPLPSLIGVPLALYLFFRFEEHWWNTGVKVLIITAIIQVIWLTKILSTVDK